MSELLFKWDVQQHVDLSRAPEKSITADIVGSSWSSVSDLQGKTIWLKVGPTVETLNLRIGKDQAAIVRLTGASSRLGIQVSGGGAMVSRLDLHVDRMSRLHARKLSIAFRGEDGQRIRSIEDLAAEACSVSLQDCVLTRLRAIANSSVDLKAVELGELAIPKGNHARVRMSVRSCRSPLTCGNDFTDYDP